MSRPKPDYGLDTAGIVPACMAFATLGVVAGVLILRPAHALLFWARVALIAAGAVPLAQGILMIHYARSGKSRYRIAFWMRSHGTDKKPFSMWVVDAGCF